MAEDASCKMRDDPLDGRPSTREDMADDLTHITGAPWAPAEDGPSGVPKVPGRPGGLRGDRHKDRPCD
jgi:hypothetical protein